VAYVIAEPCIGVKDTACVDACPVDCIHPRRDEAHFEAEGMLYIDPVECIDCGACMPVCPVSAIFAEQICRIAGRDTRRSIEVIMSRNRTDEPCASCARQAVPS